MAARPRTAAREVAETRRDLVATLPGSHRENVADRRAAGNFGQNRGTNNGATRLTEAQVISIRLRRAAGESATDLAVTYGVSSSRISSICKGKTWGHLDPESLAIVREATAHITSAMTLTLPQVYDIKVRLASREGLAAIARTLGYVSEATVARIARGRAYTGVGDLPAALAAGLGRDADEREQALRKARREARDGHGDRRHGPLSDEQVKDIRRRWAQGERQDTIANDFAMAAARPTSTW